MIRLKITELKELIDEFDNPELTTTRNTYANGEVIEIFRWTMVNIYSGTSNKFVEDRPLQVCDKCRKKKRLNIIQFNNCIISYLCDKCLKVK